MLGSHSSFLGLFMGFMMSAQTVASTAMAASSSASGELALSRASQRLPVQLKWSLELGLKRYEDALANQKKQSQFRFKIDSELELTPFLKAQIKPRLYYQNGFSQDETATTGKASNLEIAEASATLHYQNQQGIAFGAINQAKLHNSLLMDDIAFPAIHGFTTLSITDRVKLGASALGAVPTSSSLTTNTKDFEKQPSFSSAGFSAEYSQSNQLNVLAKFQYFEFKNLTTQVATDSALLGNTTKSNQSDSIYEFNYEYKGYEAQLSADVLITQNFGITQELAGVKNTQVPEELSTATLSKTTLRYTLATLTYLPSFEFYQIAPDSTVAFYAGHQTNRIGYFAGLGLQYKDLFKVSVSGGERDVLFESQTQSRERVIKLNLETLDAAI